MDPCQFMRLTVGNLALSLPLPTKQPSNNIIHPTLTTTTSPCFCKIKLKGFPQQTAIIPNNTTAISHETNNNNISAIFHLSKTDILKLTKKRRTLFKSNSLSLVIYIFTGRVGGPTCGVNNSGKMLGKVCVGLDELLKGLETNRAVLFCNGWSNLVGKSSKEGKEKLHVCVRADPDPRFVFIFDAEPECSPQVFQCQEGSLVRQPVFTCNFGFRNTVVGGRHQRTRSLQSEQGSKKGWLSSFGSERERPGKERKGWSITVHDLSGSPVAAASMVTPFVASPGSDRVSRSNPGSWLILRPGEGTWKPWGRLEAWRERGNADSVGYKFELIPDMSSNSNSGVVLAETTLSTSKGGKFLIDLASANIYNNFNHNVYNSSSSSGGESSKSGKRSSTGSGGSPRGGGGGSGDFGSGLWPYSAYRGFVMSASVEGEGKCSKPTVEVSVQHVNCAEDAAAFVALAAAIDLSIDACRLFSQKLRKELCQNNDLGC